MNEFTAKTENGQQEAGGEAVITVVCHMMRDAILSHMDPGKCIEGKVPDPECVALKTEGS